MLFARGYDDDALEVLSEKPNVRLLDDRERRTPNLIDPALRQVVGGMLVQDRDIDIEERADIQVVSQRRPTEAEWSELMFAWRVCKHVRSNAIVLSRELATVGIGAGQMSRVDSVRLRDREGPVGADRIGDGVRRLLPVCRRPPARPRRGRHGDHPAGRVGPRPRRRPGRRRRGRDDGVHRPPALPALSGAQRLGGDPPSPFEGRYGFSRVLRAGPFVLVGGTTSVDPDGVVLGGGPYEQTIEIFRKIEHELGRIGASLADVVSNRVYVTDISRSDEVGRAHGEVFGDHPAADDDGRGQRADRPANARRGRNDRLLGLTLVMMKARRRSSAGRAADF